MRKSAKRICSLLTLSLCLQVGISKTNTYSFIWNGYLKESRVVEIANNKAINISKTEYNYNTDSVSLAYAKSDFYLDVRKKNIVYANLPKYESMNFLPSETAIVKDSVLKNELVITKEQFKKAHQAIQIIYSVWNQTQWQLKTKHEISIDTLAHAKTDTEYKWLADSSVWKPYYRKISSYPASKDTAQSVATFKYIEDKFVLKNTREIIYEDGLQKEDKRKFYNPDLSIKGQTKTVYYYDDPSGYKASQQFKLNPETNIWEEKGERRIHQTKQERLAEERERMTENWMETQSADWGELKAVDHSQTLGKKTLREEMVFDPKTNRWMKFRIVSGR